MGEIRKAKAKREWVHCKLYKACVVTVLFVFSTPLSLPAVASEGDLSLIQRGGTTINKGYLSRDVRYPTYSLGVSRAFWTNVGKAGLEFSNVISVSQSSFYTLKQGELKFPLLAKTPYTLLEPAFLYDACLFVYARVRPCLAVGVSAVYLRHDSDNYVMYSGFPAQVRLQAVTLSGFIFEFGATYRRISLRNGGEVAWSSDLSMFIGMGLSLLSQF